MSEKNLVNTLILDVNGEKIEAEVEHRTSLADFLREDMGLTGTHLGCEQGVCGACTIEINGTPARSCITLAHACNNKKIRTIEGYDDDPIMHSLRKAFSQFHALQCGFCTPGFLIACRDIVFRNIENDETEIRLALSGNLCRCTGYVGIVKAVKDVLSIRRKLIADQHDNVQLCEEEKIEFLGSLKPFKRTRGILKQKEMASSGSGENDQSFKEAFRFNFPSDVVWDLISDVERMVPCVPGARLIDRKGENLKIEMQSSFGAITAKFMGDGKINTNDVDRTGKFGGSGKDDRSGSSASGLLNFAIVDDGDGCILELAVSYNITGPLAQFSRGGLVKSFASATIKMFVDNMTRMLKGEDISKSQARGLSILNLVGIVMKQWFSKLISK